MQFPDLRPRADHEHQWRQNVTGAWFECTVEGCDAVVTQLEIAIATPPTEKRDTRPPDHRELAAEMERRGAPRPFWDGPEINRKGYRRMLAKQRQKDRRRRKRLKSRPESE
jgi:hypothetical protein